MTGVGSPVIDAQGDNSIIVVPGQIPFLAPEDIDQARGLITSSDIILMQLENPVDTVFYAAGIAQSAGVAVLLNPAPAQPLPDELLSLITILTPNEIEVGMLSGCSVTDDASALQAARMLLKKNIRSVVLTLGERGAMLVEPDHYLKVPGYKVDVVDTTGAGDAFCAALAVQYAAGHSMEDSIAFANSAGALATTILGAEPAMPSLEKVKRFNQTHAV